MHENAFQFVPAIYLNMPLMFEIYRHVCARAPFSNGCSFEMLLAFKVCFFHVGWFSCCGFSREHSWFVCLMLSISCFHVSHNRAQRQRTEVIFLFFKVCFFFLSTIWILQLWQLNHVKKQIEDNERWPTDTLWCKYAYICSYRVWHSSINLILSDIKFFYSFGCLLW